jgi:hypothetical protein
VAEARPDPWRALDFSLYLASRETNTDAQQVLRWADRARALFASAKAAATEARQRFDFWETYIRASALTTLGINGDPQRFEEARRLIPVLVESAAAKLEDFA